MDRPLQLALHLSLGHWHPSLRALREHTIAAFAGARQGLRDWYESTSVCGGVHAATTPSPFAYCSACQWRAAAGTLPCLCLEVNCRAQVPCAGCERQSALCVGQLSRLRRVPSAGL